MVDWISGLIDIEIESMIDEVSAFIRDALAGVSVRRIGEPAFPR